MEQEAGQRPIDDATLRDSLPRKVAGRREAGAVFLTAGTALGRRGAVNVWSAHEKGRQLARRQRGWAHCNRLVAT